MMWNHPPRMGYRDEDATLEARLVELEAELREVRRETAALEARLNDWSFQRIAYALSGLLAVAAVAAGLGAGCEHSAAARARAEREEATASSELEVSSDESPPPNEVRDELPFMGPTESERALFRAIRDHEALDPQRARAIIARAACHLGDEATSQVHRSDLDPGEAEEIATDCRGPMVQP